MSKVGSVFLMDMPVIVASILESKPKGLLVLHVSRLLVYSIPFLATKITKPKKKNRDRGSVH